MKKLLFLILITIQFTQIINAQQAWTPAKGKFYSQLGFTYLVYDGVAVSGQFLPNPLDRKVVHHSLQGYLQYGITDKLMVTAVVPFSITKSTLTDGKTQPLGLLDGNLNGFSNILAGLTYKFHEKNGYVISGKINTILPTATQNTATGLRTGDDSFGVGPSLLAGFGHAKFFTSAEISYIYRTNNYSGQAVGGAQIGKFLGKKKRLLTILHADLRMSAKNGTYDDGNSKYTATYLNDLSYIAYGFKLGFKITPKMMLWSNFRIWASAVDKIGGRTDELGLFPGLSFAVSYQN
jgi:hypothetical protein